LGMLQWYSITTRLQCTGRWVTDTHEVNEKG
jgi:hypothetical protein